MPLKPITNESANRICCLIIGKYGLGKTSLLRTMLGQEYVDGAWTPATLEEKVCVLSAESGLLAVRDLVQAGMVEGYEIGSLQDFKDAYQLLISTPEMISRYQWIFIDSLTEIASRCEEHMKAKYPSSSDTFKMWGDYTSAMFTIVKGFRDIPKYNVVFTCLETIESDQNNKRYILPAMAGKGVKERLPSFFDEVLYMTTAQADDGTERRILYTQPYSNYPAKDRSGKLDMVEMPNLLIIKNKILGGN